MLQWPWEGPPAPSDRSREAAGRVGCLGGFLEDEQELARSAEVGKGRQSRERKNICKGKRQESVYLCVHAHSQVCMDVCVHAITQ